MKLSVTTMTFLRRMLSLQITIIMIALFAGVKSSEDFCSNQCFEPQLEIDTIREKFKRNSYVVLPGPIMRSLLKSFGAKEEDLRAMELGYIHEQLPVDLQPVMFHRKIAAHRMLLDMANNEISPAHANTCSQIPIKEIASTAGRTEKLDYQRHGTRCAMMSPDIYSKSSIPLAMARLNTMVLPHKHQHQENLNMEHNVTINDQILIRITKTADLDDSYSPTPEGIHQDNTEISSVIMIGLSNVTSGGESRLWKLDVPTGNYDEDQFKSMRQGLILNHPLRDQWETIYFSDRNMKHEARAFVGNGENARRDVLVNFLRKPLLDGTDVKLRLNGFVPV